MNHCHLRIVFLLLLLSLCYSGTVSSALAEQPTGIIEKTGNYLPLDRKFIDETGKSLDLKSIIDRPTLLLPVYYTCPRICSFDMANLALALQQTSLSPDSFKVITLSFNHLENSEDARRAKKNYTAMLKDYFSTRNWYFLTGAESDIKSVTDAIGYTYKPANDGLFIHPSALAVIGTDGRIIKYVYGSFMVGDVDLALSEAAKGTPATSIKRFIAYCLDGNVEKTETVFKVMKSAVIVLLLLGGLFLFRLLSGKEEKR